MTKFNASFYQLLEKTIESIESKSSAEVVVAVTPKSGSYKDAFYLWGAIFTLVSLVIILYIDISFSPNWIIADIAGAFVLGSLVAYLIAPLSRLFISKKRRLDNVSKAAYATFAREGLIETRDRTALLVYISTYERQCLLIRDKGLHAIPQTDWMVIEKRFSDLFKVKPLPDSIINSLQSMENILATHLPVRKDDIDELSNKLKWV